MGETEPHQRWLVSDRQAYLLHPAHCHVYDKLWLMHQQPQLAALCAPIGIHPSPDSYPIVVKPTVNLFGMSHGVHLVRSPAEYERLLKTSWSKTGMFWMPFLMPQDTMPHYTVDLFLKGGRILGSYALRSVAHPRLSIGLFLYHVYEPAYVLPARVRDWIETVILKGYTGAANIEVMGGEHVIEVHLRLNGDSYMWKTQRGKAALRAWGRHLAEAAASDPPASPLDPIAYVPVFADARVVCARKRIMSILGDDQAWRRRRRGRYQWHPDTCDGVHQRQDYVRLGMLVGSPKRLADVLTWLQQDEISQLLGIQDGQFR
jgi:hypothetical protein